MHVAGINHQSNISILTHTTVFAGLLLCIFSCSEKKVPVISQQPLKNKPVALHRTLLSDLPVDSKPFQTLLDTVPKPAYKQVTGSGSANSTAPVTHLFNDKITGLSIPEDAQGKGLFTNFTTDEGLALDQIY
jgi:hypothetical protein